MYNFSYFFYKVPGINTIKSYVMPHSTLGNPQMNSMSDSSVVDQQSVKAQEAPQHLLDPVTTLPFTNQCMYGKSSDAHCNHQEQSQLL